LLGFHVLIATRSYLLHFGGRSSWSAVDTPEQFRAREQANFATFASKCGASLGRLLFYRNLWMLSSDPTLMALEKQGGIAAVLLEMARRDGTDVDNVRAAACSKLSL
jgi:hypothetical protein